MTVIGDPNPKMVYGLSFNASWKGFDLSLLFQGTYGNDIFNASKFYFEKFDGRQNVLKSAYKQDGAKKARPIPALFRSHMIQTMPETARTGGNPQCMSRTVLTSDSRISNSDTHSISKRKEIRH